VTFSFLVDLTAPSREGLFFTWRDARYAPANAPEKGKHDAATHRDRAGLGNFQDYRFAGLSRADLWSICSPAQADSPDR